MLALHFGIGGKHPILEKKDNHMLLVTLKIDDNETVLERMAPCPPSKGGSEGYLYFKLHHLDITQPETASISMVLGPLNLNTLKNHQTSLCLATQAGTRDLPLRIVSETLPFSMSDVEVYINGQWRPVSSVSWILALPHTSREFLLEKTPF